MIYQSKSYIKFLRKSTNQHRVHSPFVYQLVTQCFYDKTHYPAYKTLKAYRKALLQNKTTITIEDFGSGSRVFTSNTRKVSTMAKRVGTPPKRQKLLYRLSKYFNAHQILELGTSLGIGTIALSLGNKNASVVTVEGCKQTAQIAKQCFENFQLNNITLKNGSFDSFFEENTHPNSYDLIYIDGHHDEQATLQLFNQILPYTNNDTLCIFDDIYWSKSMTKAWKQIVANPKVTVSIDTFHWGLVSFRKEQSKQHFHIRL